MRRGLAILVVLMAVLVVTAQPAAASHGLVVASSHSSASEFDAGQLTNMTTHTASGGSLDLAVIDGFEDEAADAGAPDHWNEEGTTETLEVQTTTVEVGSQAVHFTDNTSVAGVSGIRRSHPGLTTGNASAYIRHAGTGEARFELRASGSNIYLRIELDEELTTLSGTTITTDVTDNEWVYVEIFDINTTSDTYSVYWETDTNSGTTTGISMFNNIPADGYSRVFFTTSDEMWVDETQVETGGDRSEYISANHTVEDSEQGFVNFTTLDGATAYVDWQTSDGDGWESLVNTSYTTAGNKTDSWPVETNSTIRLKLTVVNNTANGPPEMSVASEGVFFDAAGPVVDNSSATPTGDLSTATPTLQIDVSDTDFPLAQSDSVDVEFRVDGSAVGTDTLTANGTASHTLSSPLSGGDHTWSVVATDEYGHSVTSQTFTISTPANLTVRRERPNHEVITDPIDYKIFEQTEDNPVIASGTTTDGNISLENLPAGSGLTIQLSSEQYHNRTAVIDDVFEQGDLFMLNKSATVANVTFTISDPTGQFSSERVEIELQRAINESIYNGSGGFTYMAVEGDEIGSGGALRATLQRHERYRIVVRSATETRVLGGYVPEEDTTETLRPSVPGVNVTDAEEYAWNATSADDGSTITFTFDDPDGATTDLQLVIYEQGNATNELYNATEAGPFGSLTQTVLVPSDEQNVTWVVDWEASRGGETIGGEWSAGRKITTTIPELDDFWKQAIAAILIILTGALFSQRNAETGAVTTSFVAGGFWMGGWLPSAAGGAIVVALFVAVLWKTQDGRFS